MAGTIKEIFRIGYTMSIENKMIPLEEDNTDKFIVIYAM
jgi:hypothetical protein